MEAFITGVPLSRLIYQRERGERGRREEEMNSEGREGAKRGGINSEEREGRRRGGNELRVGIIRQGH